MFFELELISLSAPRAHCNKALFSFMFFCFDLCHGFNSIHNEPEKGFIRAVCVGRERKDRGRERGYKREAAEGLGLILEQQFFHLKTGVFYVLKKKRKFAICDILS